MNCDLLIAEIGFRVTCDAGHVRPVASPYHGDFACVLSPGEAGIGVRIQLGARPSPEAASILFDAENWTMYRNASGYWVDLGRNGIAWNPAVTEVSIYYGDDLRRHDNGRVEIANPLGYPLDQLILMHHLATRRGVLLHAAGAEIGGKLVIFPGRSGAGKSTLSAQLLGHPSISMLSDDRMVARERNGAFRAYGTPWPGDAGIAVNRGAPLAALCFIAHGPRNTIRQLPGTEAAERLMPLASLPWYDATILPEVLTTLDDLVAAVPAFELSFAPTPAVADFLATFAPSL